MESDSLKELFSDDEIEIKQISFEELVSESHVEDIIKALNRKYKKRKRNLYLVKRLGKGLVQPIATLEIIGNKNKPNDYFAVRYFEKNEKKYRKRKYFDRALFHSRRMKNLKKLKGHFPQIYINNLKNGVLILQEFLFSPVCTFSDLNTWVELFEIMFLASQNKLFLDYNQNHWLYNKEIGLYYVDKDYNEDSLTKKDSTIQNFNQASIFINDINPPLIAQVLKTYLQDKKSIKKRNFANIIVNLIEKKIEILKERESTTIVTKRLKIYIQILKSIQ